MPKNDRDGSECVWRYKGVASEFFLSKGNVKERGGVWKLLIHSPNYSKKGRIIRKGRKIPLRPYPQKIGTTPLFAPLAL